MRFEIIIIIITILVMGNIYTDGKYLAMAMTWKKYYQMAVIGFVGLSAYVFMKKYHTQMLNIFSDASKMVKYMQIDNI